MVQALREANATFAKQLEVQIQATVEAQEDREQQRNRHMQQMLLMFALAIVGLFKDWLSAIIHRLLGG